MHARSIKTLVTSSTELLGAAASSGLGNLSWCQPGNVGPTSWVMPQFVHKGNLYSAPRCQTHYTATSPENQNIQAGAWDKGLEKWDVNLIFSSIHGRSSSSSGSCAAKRTLGLANQLPKYNFSLTHFVINILALTSVKMDCALSKGNKIFPWLWNAESRDMSHSDSHFPVGLIGFEKWLRCMA